MQTEFYTSQGGLLDTSDEIANMHQSAKEAEAFNYLNRILRGEIAAVEAYSKVIEKFPQDAEKFELGAFRQEHQQNVEELKRMLRYRGEEVSDTSGAWGSTVAAMVTMASFIGDKSALALLIEGEEHGLNQYSDILNYPLPEEIRAKISDTFLPQSRIHLGKLRGIANVL